MTGRVEGKVAFITGAARGQGRAHAITLAREGSDIIAVDICEDIPGVPYPGGTREELADTANAVEALGKRVITAVADVRDLPTLTAVVDQGVAEFGRLDIVAANAGIAAAPTTASGMDYSVWQDMIDINLNGAYHTCRAAIPHIQAGGRGGAIVITSSVAGLHPFANIPHYVTSKHGVVGLTKSLALELGPEGIRVNSIHPTQVATPMADNEATWRMFRPDLEAPTREDFLEAARTLQVLPTPWVEPEDIANALLFLVSDDARFITGAALPVDAGALLK
ncbi:mycofactocin-coupled SDR family oxidoreductase [Saccharopolyspora spinosa]|uniref:(+)-trans-carveol dehydrogenase/(-)-trans-carveol dehydrogenase n=1 Tax=Saccharopolyspora spinosa TaxID=60894 RepID=A0A2N3Y0U3_SACSN|nr:mycofactocin-coupled SDR family oxidoreductase [Saccharopolyspora spinosa]PKW16527.1 (+)-trans-carveol dehydrogenase/(-)-trans-carveol dehydrogenase [Saccharopolyspora spinosa]